MTAGLRRATRHPGRTLAQRRVLDAIGCGNHSPLMTDATRDAMLARGLIIELPARSEPFMASVRMTIRQFDMPTSVHMAWCEAMAKECEG